METQDIDGDTVTAVSYDTCVRFYVHYQNLHGKLLRLISVDIAEVY